MCAGRRWNSFRNRILPLNFTPFISFSFRAVNVVDDNVCLELAGNKPATAASCNIGEVCPMWFTSKWKPCDKLCGEGKQVRQVICYRKEKDGKITVLDEKDCLDEKPSEEETCMLQPCEGVDYITSSWSGVRKLQLLLNLFCYNELLCVCALTV